MKLHTVITLKVYIKADTTVYAIYNFVEKTFTVRLYNGDMLLQTVTEVPYSSDVIYADTPVYNGAGVAEDYEFREWSLPLTNVVEDRNCYALYTFIGMTFRDYMNGTLTAYVDEEGDELTTIASYAFAGLRVLDYHLFQEKYSIPCSLSRIDLEPLHKVFSQHASTPTGETGWLASQATPCTSPNQPE